MCINDEVWLTIVGLRNAGIPIGRNYVTELEGFNKPQFFKMCLRNQQTEFRSYSIGLHCHLAGDATRFQPCCTDRGGCNVDVLPYGKN